MGHLATNPHSEYFGIVRNPVFFQKLSEFLFEGPLAMMVLLLS